MALILRQTVVSLARLSDPDWPTGSTQLHLSQRDGRLHRARDRAERNCIWPEFGVEDAAPVTHENFRQWVIEDNFCAGRPDWDRVGATFSEDVHAYETMKIRILNGGHQVISGAGELLSVETISGCMTHPLISALFEKVERDEIMPHVHAVPEFAPEAYVALIKSRFSNPKIVDTTRRVAFDGSSRHPGFIVPSIRDGLAKGTPINGLALVSALWARYCLGTREDGSTVEPNDPFWSDLTAMAAKAKDAPELWLSMRHIYGDLSEQPQFSEAFKRWLTLIYSEGTEAAISAYLAG